MLKSLGELLVKNGMFAWYPNYAGGMPAYAWHHSPFHIAALLSIIFSSWGIYELSVIMLMIAAGYGMYRFLFEYINLPDWLSITGGLVFMFSCQIIYYGVNILLVFSSAFPIFFMWFLDIIDEDNTFKKKILKLIGLNFILLFSLPVLTLPYYAVL
ncbi:MAG: hypothetical protein HQK93_09220, partial [Nitrospirae bacterium]|nr:hypothetical protein [Nitrospirota bacterium]